MIRVAPRLLTRQEAASYCGLSVPAFERVCEVRAIALGDDARLRRYDVRDLDGWIDRVKGVAPQSDQVDWLGKIGDGGDGRARQGH